MGTTIAVTATKATVSALRPPHHLAPVLYAQNAAILIQQPET